MKTNISELEQKPASNWTPARIAQIQTEEGAIKLLEEWFFNFTFPQKPAEKEEWERLRADLSLLLKAQLTTKDQEIEKLNGELKESQKNEKGHLSRAQQMTAWRKITPGGWYQKDTAGRMVKDFKKEHARLEAWINELSKALQEAPCSSNS